jgi:drug/metabolite transporter (DMT)-like permease
LCGAIYFAAGSMGIPLQSLSAKVWIFGVLTGLTQYFSIKFVNAALKLGPLSPLWCALMLSFIPVIVYSAVFLHEPLGLLQGASLVSGIGCVVFASIGQTKAELAHADHRKMDHALIYGGILILAMLFNSVLSVTMKDLAATSVISGGSLLSEQGNVFMLFSYVVLGGMSLADLCVTRQVKVSVGNWLALGGLASAGSIGGIIAMKESSMNLPATLVFPVSSVTSILTTAVVSVLVFRERANLSWYGTVGFGILAVLLAGLARSS